MRHRWRDRRREARATDVIEHTDGLAACATVAVSVSDSGGMGDPGGGGRRRATAWMSGVDPRHVVAIVCTVSN